jgi:hypothetical protein
MRLFRCSVLALTVSLAPCALAAQDAREGTTIVEILGLRTWTREMVEDSVAKYQPGISLADHACAVILRDSVGFADAASIRMRTGRDTTWAVLPVVEPALRDRVRFRAFASERPKVAAWADIFAVLERDRSSLNDLQHPDVLLGDADSAFGQAVPASTLELRRKLRRHSTARDWALARNALRNDGSPQNRTVAALVLSNFPQRDSTYYLLADGLRVSDSGAMAANMVLSAMSRHAPRRIDWRPAEDALTALVGGTNLFVYTDVLDLLAATHVDPALGRRLARTNPVLLMDHLTAKNPLSSPPARRFLVHIRGQDLGRDPAAWNAWLSGD